MRNNLFLLTPSIGNFNTSNNISNSYWASNEHAQNTDGYPWIQFFGNGVQAYTQKENNAKVRCARIITP